ncbi:hypothetical protein BDM02DRAFT_3182121 [Thelephora ganbajun]|uniref:Uncharacterized protein n=1 Tax=Thelephora ganbajun TaxID=370292 RepID=A0ACB6ZXZ2_THEGA|nr:hypothetical protein BDM02DRAFT_3182121 [Thelephora ganbajun]
MCGILFHAYLGITFGTESEEFVDFMSRLRDANARRGPDIQQQLDVLTRRGDNGDDIPLYFFASELQLRGTSVAKQPHHDVKTQNILCWNGEIFEGIEVAPDENDGAKLFSQLLKACNVEDITSIFANLEGPYAFVYYENGTKRLYFGRDPLGRRSLLIHKPTVSFPIFILCSVSAKMPEGLDFEELSSDHLFSLDLDALYSLDDPLMGFNEAFQPIDRSTVAQGVEVGCFATVPRVNVVVPHDQYPSPNLGAAIPEYLQAAVDNLVSQLERSVMLQVKSITSLRKRYGEATVAILFSGGIDSAILAFLADRYIPVDEPIDLLNVAFENPRKQAKNQKPNRKKGKSTTEDHTKRIEDVVSDPSALYLVPDRVTGLESLAELRRLCPHRIWNFVEVNVPFEESQSARPLVEELMFPCRTVMDLSLAIALYFASRGVGTIYKTPDSPREQYTSPAKILLNGLGPDELLGGYGRYKTVFSQYGGWPRAVEELQMDLNRIPIRNLGRDDRVVSSHGKEVRHPFLSLPFVKYVVELPVHQKLDPRLDLGVGDKMILRLAVKQLGLVEASTRKKRAMQFGSHSARMQGGEAERKGDFLLR